MKKIDKKYKSDYNIIWEGRFDSKKKGKSEVRKKVVIELLSNLTRLGRRWEWCMERSEGR